MSVADDTLIALSMGAPGGDAINDCTDMLLQATKAVLNEKTDAYDVFKYGDDGGDLDCREMVARFLGQEYGTPVSSNNLILTSGATQGLHFLLTTMMATSHVVFMEDPAYFFAIPMVRNDLNKTLVPVPRDDEGMLPKVLDELFTTHKPQDWQTTKAGRHYWASVYFVPTFNNPTSQTYSDARLHQLVAVARKHDVLLVAEDLYRFVYFSDKQTTCASLPQTFDNESDPDYKGGHLISNSSFSKLIAPGLRLGWIEGPEWLIKQLADNNVSKSGGSFNHYTSKLVAQLIQSGRAQEQVKKARRIYKERMARLVETMKVNLPEECSYKEPTGGFYLWIALHPDTDAVTLEQFASEKYKVSFIPGTLSSVTGSFKNYVRISVARYNTAGIVEGAKRFCNAYREYRTLHCNSNDN